MFTEICRNEGQHSVFLQNDFIVIYGDLIHVDFCGAGSAYCMHVIVSLYISPLEGLDTDGS